MVATLGLLLVYENAPVLLDDGGVRVNVPPLEYVCSPIVKLVMVGLGFSIPGVIVNEVVILLLVT